MKAQAYITGIGQTQFGELFDKSLENLILEAATNALVDSPLQSFKQLDMIIIASMTASHLQSQGHLSSLVSQLLGTTCPVLSVDAACASSGSAVGIALQYLSKHHNILIIGAEKLTDHDVHDVTTALMRAASYQEEGIHGATFPALGALIAAKYFHEFNIDPQRLAAIAIKNHQSGLKNPIAHIRKPLTQKQYLASPMVSSPLRLFDCAPVSDGATAIIVSQSCPTNAVSSSIVAHAQGQDTISLHHRDTITSFKAVKSAFNEITAQTQIKPQDIDILELHDAFTVLEPIILEDLGYYQPGTGLDYYTQPDKTKPQVNLSGGYKACGHPVAASGLRQIIEIHQQLTAQAGQRQSQDPQLGLTVNFGGMAGTTSLTLIKKTT